MQVLFLTPIFAEMDGGEEARRMATMMDNLARQSVRAALRAAGLDPDTPGLEQQMRVLPTMTVVLD